MPLEFLNTGYGRIIKQKLVEKGHLHSIIKLDCEEDAFPDVTTTVGIILYDSSRCYSHVNFYSVNSISALCNVLDSEPESRVDMKTINERDKWMPYFSGNVIAIDPEKVVALEYYGRFSRGIATGANEFFAIRPSLAKELGIEISVVPCITRSSQINSAIFDERQYNELVKANSRVLLFSPNGTMSTNVLKYIRKGEQMQFNERYITKCRNPWYRIEQRDPARILLNVFSRNSYKVVLNRSNAINLTCYHGFQPNLFGQRYVERLFLYMASGAGRKILSLSKRVYGRSLDKFEPNDLNSASVPVSNTLDQISDKDVKGALGYMERNGMVPDDIESRFESIAG